MSVAAIFAHVLQCVVLTCYSPVDAQELVGPEEKILSDFNWLPLVDYPQLPEMLAVTFVMLIVLWMFPLYVLLPFMEREDSLLQYFKINGLSTLAYWLGNYLSNILISLVVLVATLVSTKVYFVSANVGLLALVLLTGMHATIGMAFLYAAVVRSALVSRLLAYITPVLLAMPAIVVVRAAPCVLLVLACADWLVLCEGFLRSAGR